MTQDRYNVFQYYGDLREAYKSLTNNQKADAKKFKLLNSFGWGLLGLAVAFHSNDYFRVLVVIGAICVVQGLIIFIDMSNRNSMLHMIDYIEWRESLSGKSANLLSRFIIE